MEVKVLAAFNEVLSTKKRNGRRIFQNDDGKQRTSNYMNHAYYEIILHIKNHFERFSFVQVGLLGQSFQDVTQKQKNKQTMDMNHEQLRKTRRKLSRPSLEINVIVPTLTLL